MGWLSPQALSLFGLVSLLGAGDAVDPGPDIIIPQGYSAIQDAEVKIVPLSGFDNALQGFSATQDYVFPQWASRSRRSPARLRHSRHSPEKMLSSYPDYPDRHYEELANGQENHKPVFAGCSTYRPSVEEEAEIGTFVIQVKANDVDPVDNGGNITYTFVSSPGERLKFNIDHYTGNITTNHIFDRDEPYREKETYLTVRATDNGRPQLDDVCTIKVTVQDINDNAPVFDKVSYRESVPQDLKPGQEVMRISATDIDDGNNSIIVYSLEPKPDDIYKDYFRIDSKSGVIFLTREIERSPGEIFNLRARATDQGQHPQSASMNLEILVVESNKKAPVFIQIPASPIILPENLTDFTQNIATLTAESNDEQAPVFELVIGRTEQTNKDTTFRLESDGNTAHIFLARRMDYESVAEYMLTIRIQNKYNLAAETSIKIQLEDVNDNMPSFTEVVSGVVLENEPPGTPVMQVRAIDADSTSAHNQVTYELADNTEYFAIDPKTGNITTKKRFDRETQDFYNVKVIATDNSPSALYNTGEPNRGQQVFRIEIADKNDHPPKFTESVYIAEAIPEDANINARVTQVNALDNDTASLVTYSIVEGNEHEAFTIDDKTGEIRVKNQLDYETKTDYTLKVRAFDGVYEDFCKVIIKIENVNDNRPVFKQILFNNITIREEELVEGCIAQVEAYDPDLQDRTVDQHIVYFVVKEEQKKLLSINKTGCLSLVKPLDRDPPLGFEKWQVLIAADDEDGGPTSLRESTIITIYLEDINDNAPFLDMVQPVIWRENQPPGVITKLVAKDNDGPENGPPFTFYLSPSANPDIQSKFSLSDSSLRALVTFDREEKKSYNVPICINDSGSPPRTGTSTLVVVIGDENDNPMEDGYSEIFVYNYKGESPDTEIGRVYVKDKDDWDLPDKTFYFAQSTPNNFDLDKKTGIITMLQGTFDQSYILKFTVFEKAPKIPMHNVTAVVNVTVKFIPEEAVDKSGSIRLGGITAEEFIEIDSNGVSKRTQFRKYLAKFLNVSEANVDIFTILHSPHNLNMTELDVRFSAHGSPYYSPEKLNAAVSVHNAEFEKELGITILMVNIDECLIEKKYCEDSCINFLNKSVRPSAVYTNTTSFVGVRAVVDPFCKCEFKGRPICFNGGTLVHEDQCECPPGFEGPRCEILSIGFNGDGWALYPPLESCGDSHLSLIVRSNKKDGLVFYAGPSKPDRFLHVQDFISLEIRDGYPLLLLDFGTGTIKLNPDTIRIDDGQHHRIDVIWSKTTIELQVDNCKLPSCLSLKLAEGPNELLNVNGPLQLGGSFVEFNYLQKYMNWTYKPSRIPFSGCIRNFTFNNKLYNLGMPGYSKNADIGCNTGVAVAVSFGLDPSFLIAILICLAILLMLLLAVVVHRRKTDDLYKDTDDIRENIINYEDEGGGEGDMTAYDLNVLRLMYNGTIQDKHHPDHTNPRSDEVPDISGFLHGKKQSVDNDPETNPFDDVRHYAYEGDGNTSGSLSSLASGTDEGDLNFDYLSNFGPRFRKLADMYGEDPSDDDDDDNYQNTASESWC